MTSTSHSHQLQLDQPQQAPQTYQCQHSIHQSVNHQEDQDPSNLNLIEPHSNSLLISSSPPKLFHQSSLSPNHSLSSSLSRCHDPSTTSHLYSTNQIRLPTHFHHRSQRDHHRHSSSSSTSSDSSSISTSRSPLMALPSPALTNPLLIPINLGLPSRQSNEEDQSTPQLSNSQAHDSLDFFSIPTTTNSKSNSSPVTSQNKTSGFFATPFSTVLPPPRLTSSQPYPNTRKTSPTHQHRLSNIFDSPSSSCNPTPSTSPPSIHHPNLSSPPIDTDTKFSPDGTSPISLSSPSRSASCPHPSHLSRIPSIKRLNEVNGIMPEFSSDKRYIPLKHSMLKPITNGQNSNQRDHDTDSSHNKHLEPPSRHPTLVATNHTLSRLSTLSPASSSSSTPTPTSVPQEQPNFNTTSTSDSSSQLLDPASGMVYQITKTLGEGSFSKVVEAKHGPSNQLVALKMIANDAVDRNERMKSSVGREIGVLQHIRHPLLVGMSAAFGTVDTLHTVLVLEHVGGGELFDLVGRAHSLFTDEFVRRTMGELIAAIGWMHQLGLVHRDIKLENILLTRPLFLDGSTELPPISEPMIKLTDFGLSRFIDLEGSLLTTRCGSEEYAAPELILGKAYDGRKTDVWALGVVGYGMIVGRLPFEGNSRRQMLVKIAKGSYEWPSSSSSEVEGQVESLKMKGNEEIQKLVEIMLVREPERRIQLEQVNGFDEFKTRWNEKGSGRRPIEGSEAARFLAGEIQIES